MQFKRNVKIHMAFWETETSLLSPKMWINEDLQKDYIKDYDRGFAIIPPKDKASWRGCCSRWGALMRTTHLLPQFHISHSVSLPSAPSLASSRGQQCRTQRQQGCIASYLWGLQLQCVVTFVVINVCRRARRKKETVESKSEDPLLCSSCENVPACVTSVLLRT